MTQQQLQDRAEEVIPSTYMIDGVRFDLERCKISRGDYIAGAEWGYKEGIEQGMKFAEWVSKEGLNWHELVEKWTDPRFHPNDWAPKTTAELFEIFSNQDKTDEG
jgi:hypothetical protein